MEERPHEFPRPVFIPGNDPRVMKSWQDSYIPLITIFGKLHTLSLTWFIWRNSQGKFDVSFPLHVYMCESSTEESSNLVPQLKVVKTKLSKFSHP